MTSTTVVEDTPSTLLNYSQKWEIPTTSPHDASEEMSSELFICPLHNVQGKLLDQLKILISFRKN